MVSSLFGLRPRTVSRSVSLGFVCFVLAGCESALDPEAPLTGCLTPAPLLGTIDPTTPGYLVVYQESTDPVGETTRLAQLYGFEPAYVYTSVLLGFAAEFSEAALIGIRCEPSVVSVSHNTTVVGLASPAN